MDKRRNREVRHADLISAGVLALIGAYLTYESLRLDLGSLRAPGAGLFPTVLSVMLVGLSILQVARAVGSADPPVAPFGPRLNHVLATVVAMAVYGGLLEGIGFPILTPVLLLGMLRGLGGLSWRRSVVIALIGTAGFFFLFRAFGVMLPGGLVPV